MKNQENLNQNELKNELQSNEPQQQSQPQSELKEQNLQTQQNLNEQESRQTQSELQSKQQHEPQSDQENEQTQQNQQNLKDEPQQAQNEQTQQNLNEQNLQKALTQKELQNHIKDKLYKTKQENLLTFLSKHYPEAFSENHINLDSLKRILGLETQARGYELNFTGKPLANALYTSPCDKELRFDFSFSPYDSKINHTQAHTIIRGDNLDALKILKQAYSNKIKMIYIDPPYNTKNENFIYPDDFRKDFKEILKETGLLEIVINDKGEEEERESEHLKFFRNITGSKSHSGWLSFMLPRLKLARDLLKEDGVIFISIDDNEQANLKLLCDEIFGEENFVSCFVWQKKSGGGQAKFFYEGHEYVLIYARDKNNFEGLFKSKQRSGVSDDFLRKVHGKYTNNLKLKRIYEKYPNEVLEHRNLMFEELDIFLQEKLLNKTKYDEIKQNLNNGTYFLRPYNDKFNLICRIDDKHQALMYSIISGYWTSDGNNENETMFGVNIFNDPKPTNFVKCLIESVTMQEDLTDCATAGGGGGGNSHRIA